LALGATAPSLLRLVLRDGLRIAILGLAAGLAAAAALARLLTRFLFNMSPFDPLTFAAASTLLALIAMVACIVPARRAMVVDPIVALRDE
jgi:ABC-type lipoprotein release transport system permease subunit